MNETKAFKAVLSKRVARELISRGYPLLDVQNSTKLPGRLVFLFEHTPELDAEFKRFERHR